MSRELADKIDVWLSNLRTAKADWDERPTDRWWARYEAVKCTVADKLLANGPAILSALRAHWTSRSKGSLTALKLIMVMRSRASASIRCSQPRPRSPTR